MSLSTELKVRFTGNFKDGQLLSVLLDGGFELHALLPGTIKAGSAGKMSQGIYNRCVSSGAELDILDEVLKIPPATGPTSEAKEVEDPDAEPLVLDDLEMSIHAFKIAKENDLDPIALFDKFGEGPIMKKDVESFIQSLSE